MNKTTSFSKLKNKKNDNLLLNHHYQTNTNISSSPAFTIKDSSFFIDSINENTSNKATNLVDKSSNLLFEPAPLELFADSIIESPRSNHINNRINIVPTIELNQYGVDPQQSKLKNWNSESNLAATKTRKKIVKLNKSCIHKNDDDEIQDDENCESYYDYDLENDPLQFSDHAGLFDAYDNENNEQEENGEEDLEQNDNDFEEQTNLNLINNYDFYKATKHNYKLTYNDDNHSLFALDKLANTLSKKNQIDSLINSDLVMQQNNYHTNNYDDEDELEDNDDDNNNHEYNQQSINTNQNETNYLYYLNKLNNEQSQSQISNSNLNDSIMNWSMKISNYNYTNHYQQQKQQLEYQLHNNKVKRSQSRSPERINNASTHQMYENHQIPRSNSSFSKLYFNKVNNQMQQQKLSNKSTTSWGKLKHSKSSSSNFAGQPTNNESSQSTSNQVDDEYDDDTSSKQMNLLESVHVNDNLIKQPLSSPSLFHLFQNTKSNNLNSSSETNTSNNQRTNRRTDHLNQQKKQAKQDESSKISKTTSFSQIRQRSLSSCAIGQNQDYNSSPTSQQMLLTPTPTSTLSPRQNLVVVVDTTNGVNGSHSKKSIGIQHPASNQIDQSIQTSTIVCMLVDTNNSKTSKELIEVAARAARAAVAARRSYNLFNTKSSLPDLTFLKDYSDDLKKSPNNSCKITNEDDTKLDESLLDEPVITNNIQLKNSLSSANLIKPISDLIKLDELAIKKTLVNPQTNQPQPQQQPNITGSELLKRKTLKSIKRYRQTKQNTEPCNLITDNISLPNNNTEQIKQQKVINSNNSSSSSTSSSSGATNTSGYVSNAATNTNLIQTNQQLMQQQSDKLKQPLKSCLKRKDSATSSSNTQQQQQQSPPQPIQQPQQSKSKINSASSLIVTKQNKSNQLKKQTPKKSSTLMFLPYVGYLYTWDKDSSTRYVYYNNLEKTRRIKSYKQMIRNSLDEDDDEDDEDEDVTKEQAKQPNEPQMVTSSRSYNDLRVKKSVTFLSHVIEHKQTPKKSKSMSPSSTIETDITSTPTTGTLSTSSSTNSTKQTNSNKLTTPAPLLQYDALIAMLKSNSLQKQSGLDAKTLNRQSPQLVSKTKHIKNTSNNSFNKNKLKLDRQNSNEINYFKKSQIIDADSISLASLSESPPSEFKFSDDEDYSNSKLDEHLTQAITSNKSFNTNTNSSSATSSSSAGSSSSTNIINKLNNQQHLPQHNQQIKFNQLELIRNKKKNFHSILLKDNKLNNLKEILLEIKEQQQKLIQLANDSKNQKESALIETSSTNISGSTGAFKALNETTISVGLNQTSIIATTSTDNTVSIELKDTIERLAQYLFEFLKQGLKPATFDQLAQTNLSNSSIKTTTSSNTAAMSPSPVERALPDSSSLTITYSQYTQLWNLIEHTISMNLAATTQQSDLTFQCFKLPKEAYLSMYQEINSYSNNTNQTYLIDSGINTSQLRRKHHFMVNLMSLKFKFQLFIINLLNYKQLANWFEYLNKDKTIIKKFYDLKAPISNINGDSGVGDFICMSGSSSSTNSSLSNHMNFQQTTTANLIASLSLNSLANVSIFENEEYFSYFSKLLQQFNFIEFNLKISKQMDKSITQRSSSPATTPKPAKYPQSPRKSSSSLSRHHTQPITSIPISPSTPHNFTHNSNQQQHHHQSSNNVFKNISKRFNIKSWFTSSSQQNATNSNTLPNYQPNQPNMKSPQVSSQQYVYKKASQAPTTNKLVGTKSKGASPLVSTPFNKLLNSNQLMKHSCSEPSLNEIIE